MLNNLQAFYGDRFDNTALICQGKSCNRKKDNSQFVIHHCEQERNNEIKVTGSRF
jgi:hypothetical protein